MLSATDIIEIIKAISYKPGWTLLIGGLLSERPYVQMSVDVQSDATLDSVKRDGTRTPWKSGKRYLSYHMCRQEVVGAVWGLIQDAEMHEAREWFRYKGASIYNPHLDPDVLAEVARKASSFNVRDNAMTMDEQPAPVPDEPSALKWIEHKGGILVGIDSLGERWAAIVRIGNAYELEPGPLTKRPRTFQSLIMARRHAERVYRNIQATTDHREDWEKGPGNG